MGDTEYCSGVGIDVEPVKQGEDDEQQDVKVAGARPDLGSMNSVHI